MTLSLEVDFDRILENEMLKNVRHETPENNNNILMMCLSVFHYIKKKKVHEFKCSKTSWFPCEGLQHWLQSLLTTLRANRRHTSSIAM